MTEPARIAVRWRATADLKPDPHNARVHSERQVTAIADSIAAFGFNVPLLIDGECRVIAGHGRLRAAERLGLAEAPTIMLEHLDDAARRAFMIADNRLAEFASWDGALLGLELKALGDLDLDFALSTTGFSLEEIDRMLDSAAPSARLPGDSRDDPRPAIPGTSRGSSPGTGRARACPEGSEGRKGRPVARAGDAWRLGPHRLLCGEGDDDAMLAADAAIRRWQAQSGDSARLEPTRESFASAARARRAKVHGAAR